MLSKDISVLEQREKVKVKSEPKYRALNRKCNIKRKDSMWPWDKEYDVIHSVNWEIK